MVQGANVSGMFDLDRQYDGQKAATRMPQPAMRGFISQGAATKDDFVTVILEGEFDETLSFGPCRWMPHGNLFPEQGDPCIMIFDGQMIPWVVGWWTERTNTVPSHNHDDRYYTESETDTKYAHVNTPNEDDYVHTRRDNVGDTALAVDRTSDSQMRWLVQADGSLLWGNGSDAPDVKLSRFGANQLRLEDQFQIARPNGTDIAAHLFAGSETQSRWNIDMSGLQLWGDGSAAQDTNLYRGAANQLKTDDAFLAANLLGLEYQSLISYANHNVGITTTRVLVASGTITLPSGWTSMDVIFWGAQQINTNAGGDHRYVVGVESPDGVAVMGDFSMMSIGTAVFPAEPVTFPLNGSITGLTANQTIRVEADVTGGSTGAGDVTAVFGFLQCLKIRRS